jgi:hypothetical protein
MMQKFVVINFYINMHHSQIFGDSSTSMKRKELDVHGSANVMSGNEPEHPDITFTEADLTLIGKTNNKAGNGVAFQVLWHKPKTETVIVSGAPGNNTYRVSLMGRPGEEYAVIDRFHMLPEYRNHTERFGTKVMDMIKRIYRDGGTSRLLVTNPRHDAVKWYKGKQGFENNDVKDLEFALNPIRPGQPVAPVTVERLASLCRAAGQDLVSSDLAQPEARIDLTQIVLRLKIAINKILPNKNI